MNKTVRDLIFWGGMGALVGALPGLLAASAWAVFRVGGELTQIDPLTIRYFAPGLADAVAAGSLGEPFQTAAMIGLAVFVAFITGGMALGFKPRLTSHGSARWATKDDLRRADLLSSLKEIKGPIYAKTGKEKSSAPFISSRDIPHSLVAAPTGSGKGVGVVIPTLLTFPGSCVVLDLKGENFEATARRRVAMKDRVFKFAPYDEGDRTHRFNPLQDIPGAPKSRRFTEARRAAAALITAESKGAAGFLNGAREIFAATALLAVEEGNPTIARVYDILSESAGMNQMFHRLSQRVEAREARAVFTRMAAMEGEVLGSYMSVLADGGLSLWGEEPVREATMESDFNIADFRRAPSSLYIVVSPNDLVPLAPLIRVLFQQSIATLQQSRPKAKEVFPVLFLLDEFAALGKMDVLTQAIGTLRGYGGMVMIVVQSMANLRDLYGRDAMSVFLTNCRLQLFMAPADEDTPEYISRAIGDFTRKSRSKSWSTTEIGKTNVQERAEGSRLMRSEDLRTMSEDDAVLLVQGRPPIQAKKVRYYKDQGLEPLFSNQSGPMPEPEPLSDRGNPLRQAKRDAEAKAPATGPAHSPAEPAPDAPANSTSGGTLSVNAARPGQDDQSEDDGRTERALDVINAQISEVTKKAVDLDAVQAVVDGAHMALEGGDHDRALAIAAGRAPANEEAPREAPTPQEPVASPGGRHREFRRGKRAL